MKKNLFLLVISCTLLLTSCLTSKKVVYINDMKLDSVYAATEAPILNIQKGDRLSIVVSSKSPELAVPFNQGLGNYQINEQGDLSTGSMPTLSTMGYLVGHNGEIEFPILGILSVEGLSLHRAEEMIKTRLRDAELIGDPMVKVELLNLKINMMGEVAAGGILNVPDARITILEAISRSGGLTSNAEINEIAVIREENGVRKMYLNNIESTEIFNSPTYYLQQNDIVYVKPRDATATQKENMTWRYIGAGIGLLGTLFALLNLIK